MPRLTSLVVLTLLTSSLLGCLGEHGHRVHVRRTPEEIARANRQPKDYAELIDDLKAEEEENALNGPLRRSEAHYHLTELHVDRIKASGEDPWEDYEDERRRVLYRKWVDAHRDPPDAPAPEAAAPAPAKEEAEGEGEEEGFESEDDGF
ncbi:MAG TPA: hypothetical protein DEA08_20900 [Planctomycetes bacterium]|nr:hypothetical protein [Planctomycetota bacterium]